MSIGVELLEKTCKNMIETILTCLPHAMKGTVYQVGPLPELRIIRITSGMRKVKNGDILWGLPAVSDYNYPGKTWEEYSDRFGHPLEAMGWCVEQQKSWTADNPYEDSRSVRKQLLGEIEDSYHMEPVLARKYDLVGNRLESLRYPPDWRGNPIWQDTEYVVVAVIKIHFLPNTLQRNDYATKTIKKLSRSLGTELLSLYLRETIAQAQKEFTRQRLESCEILAHELRNTLAKFSFIFSAVNTQISVLRGEWEAQLRGRFPELDFKNSILDRLNELIRSRLPRIREIKPQLISLANELMTAQEELSTLNLLPDHAQQWLKNKIQPKWEHLLTRSNVWEDDKGEIRQLLERLGKSLWIGMDEDLAKRSIHLPSEIREKWPKLAYVYFTAEKLWVLDEILQFLAHPKLEMPHKEQVKKTLISLKAMVEIIPEVEERTNRIILSLKNGGQPEPEAEHNANYALPYAPMATHDELQSYFLS